MPNEEFDKYMADLIADREKNPDKYQFKPGIDYLEDGSFELMLTNDNFYADVLGDCYVELYLNQENGNIVGVRIKKKKEKIMNDFQFDLIVWVVGLLLMSILLLIWLFLL